MSKKKENMISFVYQFRNKVNAVFGDDKDFMILEINEPLPDGTIDYHEGDGDTLNIISSNVVKLTLLRDYLGDTFEDGEKLYIDYYFGRNMYGNSFVNVANRPSPNARLDIAMLFEGNPHFSKFYSGYGNLGPWFCVAFKPECVQYYNEDATAIHGRKTTVMEDIARELFPDLAEQSRVYFSTENIEDFIASAKLTSCDCTTGTIKLTSGDYTTGISSVFHG